MADPEAAIEDLVRRLPKAELHVHLEGSIDPPLAARLAARHGIQLPGGLHYEPRARYERFVDFAELYLAISSCLQEADDFTLAVQEVGRGLLAQNVRYAEMTFTPWTHVARGVDPAAMLVGLLEGRASALEQGIVIRWVFDIVRHLPDTADPTLDFGLDLRRADPNGVVGLGLGGPEGPEYPIEPFEPVFERARSEGLVSLPHAGEQTGASSVRDAVERLGAARIGHGFRCLEDPQVVELLLERDIPLEICPSSNVALGWVPSFEAHPLPRLLDAGLRVSLGSDDPPLFSTDIVREYARCAAVFGWDASVVRRLAAAAVEHSQMDDRARTTFLVAQNAVV